MRAEIICVGTELLLGDILNTNAQYLSRALSEIGIAVYNQQVVGDNRERLAQAVEIAKRRSDIVIFSGGLGPTDDDLTKQTVAEIYNDSLVHNQQVEDRIRLHFERMGRQMTENNIKQAYVPQRGKFIPNENGTAPGIIFIDGEKLAILLPGPPRELIPMMDRQVMPLLRRLVKGVIKSRYIKTMCIGESMLETKIPHLLASENPTAALYAKGDGEVTVRVTAKADTEQQAEDMLEDMQAQLYAEISQYIYGVDVDNAETVIVDTLKKSMQTVAVAESCTGGKIASRITSVAGASQVFELGLCTYSNKQKVEILDVNQDTIEEYTEVSSQVAAQMAENVRRMAESDYGVATTGYAGPGGKDVGLVYIAVAAKDKTYVVKHHFAGSREVVINLASQYALDLLRRVIFNLPTENAQEMLPEQPKKKAGKGKKVFVTFVVMLLLATAIAFGWLYLKGSGVFNTTFLTVFTSTPQSVSEVVAQRQSTDFFSQGFEQETSLLMSGSWAQNQKLESWITIKNIPAEYAVGKKRHSEKQQGSVVYRDEEIAGMTTLAGFDQNTLYKQENLAGIDSTTKMVVFSEDGSYDTYSMFAVVNYTQQEYEGLFKMTDANDIVDEALRKTAVSFNQSDVTGFDDIIILKQTGENGDLTLYFTRKGDITLSQDNGMDSSVETEEPQEENPEEDTSEEENSAEDENGTEENSGTEEEISDEKEESEKDDETEEDDNPSSTATPSPTPSSSVKPTAKPSDAAKPTATPKPTATAKPTPTPTAKPTPTPTAKPTPVVTPQPTPPPSTSGKTLTVTADGQVVTGPAEEILAKIVSREMTGTWDADALKAQAIASHTYLVYQYNHGNSAPAVSFKTPYATVTQAVSEVADLIMTVNGQAAYTPYFASSAGRTNSSAEVWGGHYSHLVSVESKYDYQASGYKGTVTVSKDKMEQIIRDVIGVEPSGEPSEWIKVLDKTGGGYNNNMSVCGATTYYNRALKKTSNITGRWMREDILKGAGSSNLRSAAFDVNFDGTNFIFTTYGYGHGAGMSQWGAQLYAVNEGWSYEQILKHYYQGVTITSY